MDFKELNHEATQRAEKAIKTGFDVQAYTVIALNEIIAKIKEYETRHAMHHSSGHSTKTITEAHDGSCTMHDCYNAYSDKKTDYRQGKCASDELVDLLHDSLKTSRKIIAEMYANCDIIEEQNAIKEFIESLVKLIR